MKNNFNIIISGVGGQGLLTLTKIIAEAAMMEGYQIKTSELHGLSQRGGSVQTHIRFGKEVFSPLISLGKADLILGLEVAETLRNINYANPKTIILGDKYQLSYQDSLSVDQITKKINALFKGKKYLISASETCKKKFGNEVVAGVYLLGYAVKERIIPLRANSLLRAVSMVVPEKYLDLNKKAFNL